MNAWSACALKDAKLIRRIELGPFDYERKLIENGVSYPARLRQGAEGPIRRP